MSKKEEPKWLFCDDCDYKTPFPSNLKMHKKARHFKAMIIKYKCVYCDNKKFKVKYDLKQHVKKAHEISVDAKGCISCTDPATLNVIDNPKEILLDEKETDEDKQYIQKCLEKMNNKGAENIEDQKTSQITDIGTSTSHTAPVEKCNQHLFL